MLDPPFHSAKRQDLTQRALPAEENAPEGSKFLARKWRGRAPKQGGLLGLRAASAISAGYGNIRRSSRHTASAVRREGGTLFACRPDGAGASGRSFRFSLHAVWNVDDRSHPSPGRSGRARAFPASLWDLGRRNRSKDRRRARPQRRFCAGAPALGICGVRAGIVQARESQGLRLSPGLGRIFPWASDPFLRPRTRLPALL